LFTAVTAEADLARTIRAIVRDRTALVDLVAQPLLSPPNPKNNFTSQGELDAGLWSDHRSGAAAIVPTLFQAVHSGLPFPSAHDADADVILTFARPLFSALFMHRSARCLRDLGSD